MPIWKGGKQVDRGGNEPGKGGDHDVPYEYTLEGFEPDEVVGLTWLRQHYLNNQAAEFFDSNLTYQRLEFTRWLALVGKLTEFPVSPELPAQQEPQQ